MVRLAPALFALAALGCLPRIPTSSTLAAPLPPARATVQLCRLTGETVDHPKWLGVDGLSFDPYHSVIGSIVVRRADGLLMIDSGFSRAVKEDMARGSLLFKLALGGGDTKTPVVQLADQAGLDPLAVRWVALTHAHWDHTGGLQDLARARVLLARDELRAYSNLHGWMDKGALTRHLDLAPRRFEPFDFEGPPLLGFEQSHDLFGDGSVVAVPLPGHTPGSVGYLVRGDDGKNWLFVGDATWTVDGVTRPAHKNALVALLFDGNLEATAQTLARLHAVQVQRPEVTVVPAHDLDAMGLIPECQRAR